MENECVALQAEFNYAALRRFRRSADGTRARIATFSIFNSQFLNRSIMRSTKDFSSAGSKDSPP